MTGERASAGPGPHGFTVAFAAASVPGAGPPISRPAAARPAPCAACHGADGNATIPGTPSLAGHAGLLHALAADHSIATGAARDPQMSPFGINLSDADMADLAAYLRRSAAAAPARRDRRRARRRWAAAGGGAALHVLPRAHPPGPAGGAAAGRAGLRLLCSSGSADYKAKTTSDLDGMMTMVAQPLTDADVENLTHFHGGFGIGALSVHRVAFSGCGRTTSSSAPGAVSASSTSSASEPSAWKAPIGESFEVAADPEDPEAADHPSVVAMPDGRETPARRSCSGPRLNRSSAGEHSMALGPRIPAPPKFLDVKQMLSVQTHPPGKPRGLRDHSGRSGRDHSVGVPARPAGPRQLRGATPRGPVGQEQLLDRVRDAQADCTRGSAPGFTTQSESAGAVARDVAPDDARAVETLLLDLARVYRLALDALNEIPVAAGSDRAQRSRPMAAPPTFMLSGNPEGRGIVLVRDPDERAPRSACGTTRASPAAAPRGGGADRALRAAPRSGELHRRAATDRSRRLAVGRVRSLRRRAPASTPPGPGFPGRPPTVRAHRARV
mgnify:CR=1 FL=1